jgi:defect-in-organelle-trafficking protein DotB
MENEIEFTSLKYNEEPTRFGINDIEKFIIWCVKQNASDITIQNEEQIFCEIHGKFHRVTNRRLSKPELIDIISAIYKSDGAVSRLNGGEDVDIPWNVRLDRSTVLRFRVNMTAIFTDGHKGYQITIRTITNRAPLLESLNLPSNIINNLSPKEGFIIIVGATGSGKSTFLASTLDWRMRAPNAHLKILTYESPIEFVYDDVPKPTVSIAQTEIGTHLETFELGVRNALRRKPSIILMGELRDRETIGEGITASMTGHLVYGTLHSTGVAQAVRRMVNVFAAEEKNARALDILTSLKLIIAQKLVPSTDGKRIALREYLVFTQDIVEELLGVKLDNLTYEISRMVEKYGKTFLQDATEKYEVGLISKDTFEDIRKLTKGAKKDIEDDK